MTEIEADYLRDEKRQLELRNIEIAKAYEELQEENTRLKKESEENQDLATIAYMQGASKYKTKLDEAKTIIQDLLRNSDEYARQRAMDWLKEK